MASYQATVTVRLHPGVLDPQGQAIEGALSGLGFGGVDRVRQGKVFDLALDADSETSAQEAVSAMCEKLLANTVIETYEVELRKAS